jgi:succinoglycan biosynthesis protein ExoM
LKRLLADLQDQRTDELFTYSVVVADNDPEKSAKECVEKFSKTSRVRISYCFESQPNIAMARNKSLENAEGDFIAFIDDDEFPAKQWLRDLLKTCLDYGVDGVLGPVLPSFESSPPEWAIKGKFFDRPTYRTGHPINWEQARTGNVLFRRTILIPGELPFRTQFDTAGEDVDFFRRMMAMGCKFIWCNEAAVHELVPASRCNRTYLLKRALLRGSNFHKHPTNRVKNTLKSLIAVPCYLLALPIFAILGQHIFLRYLCKLLDHASRLLSFLGLELLTERQT